MIIPAFCFLLVIIFIFVHVRYHLKVSNSLDVYEINKNTTKECLNEICQTRHPVFFQCPNHVGDHFVYHFHLDNLKAKYGDYNINTNCGKSSSSSSTLTLNEFMASSSSSSSSLSIRNYEFLMETGLDEKFNLLDEFFRPFATLTQSYDMCFLKATGNDDDNMQIANSFRSFLFCVAASERVVIRLYPPNQFSNQTKNATTLKYVDVFFTHPNQCVVIPTYWRYKILSSSSSSSSSSISTILRLEYSTLMTHAVRLSESYSYDYFQNLLRDVLFSPTTPFLPPVIIIDNPPPVAGDSISPNNTTFPNKIAVKRKNKRAIKLQR